MNFTQWKRYSKYSLIFVFLAAFTACSSLKTSQSSDDLNESRVPYSLSADELTDEQIAQMEEDLLSSEADSEFASDDPELLAAQNEDLEQYASENPGIEEVPNQIGRYPYDHLDANANQMASSQMTSEQQEASDSKKMEEERKLASIESAKELESDRTEPEQLEKMEDNTPLAENEIRVQKGDSLAKLAKRHFEAAHAWPLFLSSNPELNDNPHQLEIGQVLTLPSLNQIAQWEEKNKAFRSSYDKSDDSEMKHAKQDHANDRYVDRMEERKNQSDRDDLAAAASTDKPKNNDREMKPDNSETEEKMAKASDDNSDKVSAATAGTVQSSAGRVERRITSSKRSSVFKFFWYFVTLLILLVLFFLFATEPKSNR